MALRQTVLHSTTIFEKPTVYSSVGKEVRFRLFKADPNWTFHISYKQHSRFQCGLFCCLNSHEPSDGVVINIESLAMYRSRRFDVRCHSETLCALMGPLATCSGNDVDSYYSRVRWTSINSAKNRENRSSRSWNKWSPINHFKIKTEINANNTL